MTTYFQTARVVLEIHLSKKIIKKKRSVLQPSQYLYFQVVNSKQNYCNESINLLIKFKSIKGGNESIKLQLWFKSKKGGVFCSNF